MRLHVPGTMKRIRRGRAPQALMLFVVLAGAGCTTTLPESRMRVEPSDQFEAFLWNDPFPKLVVDVDHIAGLAPREDALDLLVERIREGTGKIDVTHDVPEEIPGLSRNDRRAWTYDEAWAIHTATYDLKARRFGQGDTAFLHVVYLDGAFEQGTVDASGVEIEGVIFLFKDAYMAQEYRAPGESRSFPAVVERHVLIHELGHVLGLVNCGIPMIMERENPESRCHSRSKDSVMYSATLAQYGFDRASDPGSAIRPTEAFDDADLGDLTAFRGKQARAR